MLFCINIVSCSEGIYNMLNFVHMNLHRIIGFLISVLVVLSCTYNYIASPEIMCLLNNCNTSKTRTIVSIFPRAVAITCMISRIAVLYKNISAIVEYKKKIKEYEIYYPITVGHENSRRLIIVAVTVIYVVLILPTNVYRLCLVYYYYESIKMIVYILMMYIQNASMCMTEIQFMVYCSGLYKKYQSINEDMSALKSKTISTNRYPLVLKPNGRKSVKVYPSISSVETLKMRHQFVSESVGDLNEVYSIQLGMSLSILFIMVLFDLYAAISTELIRTKTNFLLYGWITQYIFRFVVVILASHMTTKQVINVGLIKYNIINIGS